MGRKDPVIAAILSFLLMGLGHIYLGRIGKGLLFLFAVVLIIPLAIICVPIAIALYAYAIYSAYSDAKAYNAFLLRNGYPPW